jgi:hypothetical protein
MTEPTSVRMEERSGERTGAERITPDERAPVAQWVGMFLAPAAFALHLQINYNLVPWACVRGGDLWVHLVDLVAVLVSLAGTIVAWRVWLSAGRQVPGEEGDSLARTRFMGATGLGFGATITLVLIAQWAAAFFISTCQ